MARFIEKLENMLKFASIANKWLEFPIDLGKIKSHATASAPLQTTTTTTTTVTKGQRTGRRQRHNIETD